MSVTEISNAVENRPSESRTPIPHRGTVWAMFRGVSFLSLVLLAVVGCRLTGGAVRGDYDLDLRDRAIEDESDATVYRLQGELYSREDLSRFRPGAELDVLVVDDDLDEVAGAEAIGWEGFVYASYHPKLGRFVRLPIRFGPVFHYFELDDILGEELRWGTLGLKGGVAPELVLIRSRQVTEELTVFGDLNGWAGRSVVESDDGSDPYYYHDDRSAAAYSWGWEAGVRYRFERFELQGSYFYRWLEVDEADRDHGYGPDITGIRNEISGVGISVSVDFGHPRHFEGREESNEPR